MPAIMDVSRRFSIAGSIGVPHDVRKENMACHCSALDIYPSAAMWKPRTLLSVNRR